MPVLKDLGAWNKKHGNKFYTSPYYKNPDSVENVIRYISRTRFQEDRANECICVGGSGVRVGFPVECIIEDILTVQRFYRIDERLGRRVYHYTYQFTAEEFDLLGRNYGLVNEIAKLIGNFFYLKGFQTVYAIHHDLEKKVHIHLAINSINYINGKKLQVRNFEEMKKIFYSYYLSVIESSLIQFNRA